METNVQTCYRHPGEPAGIVCQRCDRPICPKCMHQASVGFHCPECVKSGRQTVISGPSVFTTRPVVTQVLVAINVGVFLIGVAMAGAGAISGGEGSLQIDFGLVAKLWQLGPDRFYYGPVPGSHPIGVGAGEWYRMVTSGFLHYGIFHLLMNMYALWILGSAVERMAGRLRFGLIYGVSLLTGSLGALVLSPDNFTAGASGAIFGLMGALLLAQRAQGVPFRYSPLMGLLVLNILITFGIPGISIGGHLGGLAGGCLAGWLLFDVGARPNADKRMPLLVCGAVGLGCLVAGIVFATGYTPG